jgi:hypothetical protein
MLVDATKTCTKCGEQKPEDQFFWRSPGQRGAYCKVCRAAQQREAYARDPDRWAGYNRAARYGLTPEQFDQMVADQKGCCRLCGDEPTGERHTGILYIDHDHETGKVRGLVCHRCNLALGHFRDDPALMRRAADYVEAARC